MSDIDIMAAIIFGGICAADKDALYWEDLDEDCDDWKERAKGNRENIASVAFRRGRISSVRLQHWEH